MLILANEAHALSTKNLVKDQFSLRSHAKDTITSSIKKARPNVGSYHVIIHFINLFMLLSWLVSINMFLFLSW